MIINTSNTDNKHDILTSIRALLMIMQFGYFTDSPGASLSKQDFGSDFEHFRLFQEAKSDASPVTSSSDL